MDASQTSEVARCVFQESSDALFIFNPRDQRVLDVNPTAQRLTGFSKKALRGMSVGDLFSSSEPGGVARFIHAYQSTGFFHSQEGYFLNRSEGAPLSVNVSISRIHTDPEPLGLAMARDVTERRQAQEVLDRFFRLSPDLFVIASVDGFFLKLNPAWEQALGYERAELMAAPYMDFVHPDDWDATRAASTLLLHGELDGFENRYRHKDGTYRWLSWRATYADGVLYSVARDITEKKAAEAARARLTAILEATSDVVASVTLDATLLYINRAGRRLAGLGEHEDLSGINVLDCHPPWARDLILREGIPSALRDGLWGGETAVWTRDGREVPVSLVILAHRAPDGTIDYLSTIARDLSERKRAEQALEQARDAAEVANRAKSAFLANMSHEMRTPLTAILGFTDLLMEDEWIRRAPAEGLENLRIIHQNGRHLLELIDDILDLSKVESGRTVVQRVRCAPGRIAADVIAALRVRSAAKGLSLDDEYATPVPATIQTDPVRLRQILINLIGNAIKFTERGGVRLRIGLDRASLPEPSLWFEVIDTGIGMTPAEQVNLFQPFCRAGLPASQKAGGTGLGLAISKRLAELLGGAITVETLPGEGSTFRLTVATGPLEGIALHPHPRVDRSASEAVSPPGRRPAARLDRRVLLAEDNPVNQRVVSTRLERAGAAVTVARNGLEALDLALAARETDLPFDVILMDMQMPILDGYEATRLLRAQGYDGPIIALTAYAMAEDRDECLRFGCTDHISKPIDWDRLLDRIASFPPQTLTPRLLRPS